MFCCGACVAFEGRWLRGQRRRVRRVVLPFFTHMCFASMRFCWGTELVRVGAVVDGDIMIGTPTMCQPFHMPSGSLFAVSATSLLGGPSAPLPWRPSCAHTWATSSSSAQTPMADGE